MNGNKTLSELKMRRLSREAAARWLRQVVCGAELTARYADIRVSPITFSETQLKQNSG